MSETDNTVGTLRIDRRRTYASRTLEAVQDPLGHEDPRTTRLYQGPVRVARAVVQLEALLES